VRGGGRNWETSCESREIMELGQGMIGMKMELETMEMRKDVEIENKGR
jgi:hypothetical protein